MIRVPNLSVGIYPLPLLSLHVIFIYFRLAYSVDTPLPHEGAHLKVYKQRRNHYRKFTC